MLLGRRDPCLCYRNSGEMPMLERDSQLITCGRTSLKTVIQHTHHAACQYLSIEAQIGIALRSIMDSNGFSNTKIIGYEHNWDDAAQYPVQLVRNENDL
ncbi:hypothetical protein JVT61DRAFT_9071 [Boletus reticuloceps]|uniref:Uncharacterized protein n=1 Tax=Boletus reticuloceps TaxID=495285 RepID=A0A8I2YGG8_9AGAM|nr:hypothetical protein JVT61DRAFT_9071 [Boletus reticuloceps]